MTTFDEFPTTASIMDTELRRQLCRLGEDHHPHVLQDLRIGDLLSTRLDPGQVVPQGRNSG
jgi:hypothetical protein